MAKVHENLRETIETILRCNLTNTVGIPDAAKGEDRIEQFLHVVADRKYGENLARWIDPQWVVLAAGTGSRIDPLGNLNKNLDVWFGEQNTLQLSRRCLPGSRPHIIVINAKMASRVISTDIPADGVVPVSALNQEAVHRLFGPNAILCIQPEQPYGTGAALHAAMGAISDSDAELVGVGFGDEPFLNRAMYVNTLISHVIAGADITLCGKIPETVIDKGGLFFDIDGKFTGTKEWFDMTNAEQREMRRRFEREEAFTNTGITLIRRDAAIDRMDRLQPHGSKSELHHVDLIRHCYDDGLKTNAYIYEEEIISGVNRWANVHAGEDSLFENSRRRLAQKGIRVDPNAQIFMESEKIEIGHGCYILGRVHLGAGVRIGNYCRLENVVLGQNTTVGDLVGLTDVQARDTAIESNSISTEVAAPIAGLAVQSRIENSQLDRVKIGHSVHLNSVHANATVIPSGISANDVRFGVRVDTGLGLPSFGPVQKAIQTNLDKRGLHAISRLALPDYKPGMFTFFEKRRMPDWDNLLKHVQSHSACELIPRATRDPALRKTAIQAVDDLLDMQKTDGTHVIDDLTPEQLWGCIFEIAAISTGNRDPYRRDKHRARQTAINLIDEFSECNWLERLKLITAANIIDYNSARVVKKIEENPDYFVRALREALNVPFAIDCFEKFNSIVISGEPKRLIWLADNDGEAVFDLWFIQMLAECGHEITVAGKGCPAGNDATLDDLREIAAHPCFQELRDQIQFGDVSLISSGSATIGTDLNQATPEFVNALLDADVVISKGQGNFYTTQGLKRDSFHLFLSKGVTAERSTGVVANRDAAVDGLILAFLPSGTRWTGTLKQFSKSISQ
ncbi:MAG: ARMT1-like domain-containing protein [Candidatus Poribacteria bacterium]|nr:ARMT1-like domain-containing protein [Candidatus Poribacteria bacterium]